MSSESSERIMAFDVGSKSCGIAVTDPLGITVQPLTTVRYKGWHDQQRAFQELQKILTEYTPAVVVIGLPTSKDGGSNVQCERIQAFTKGFQNHLKQNNFAIDQIQWEFCDESHSSQEVEELMISFDVSRAKRAKVIDQLAAVVILRRFLGE
ncbi:MAG: Holliday junction resolvase RuvX [Deltaproteobacteria bacterium]|nr:Holliday junction resolvase RuvX [Deltaproteobacteria bacterium]